MTLPFHLTLIRGRCRVINCPNFNVVVFQGIGRPEERERWGTVSQLGSQNTYNI